MTSQGVAAQANVIRGGTRRRKWTPGVLAPVRVEGRVTVAEGGLGSRIVYGELHQRDERGPVILTPIDEGAEYDRNHAVHTFGARVGIMMVRRSENERPSQGRMQGCPELRSKARVAVEDQRIGQANIVEDRRGDEVPGRRPEVAVLNVIRARHV